MMASIAPRRTNVDPCLVVCIGSALLRTRAVPVVFRRVVRAAAAPSHHRGLTRPFPPSCGTLIHLARYCHTTPKPLLLSEVHLPHDVGAEERRGGILKHDAPRLDNVASVRYPQGHAGVLLHEQDGGPKLADVT